MKTLFSMFILLCFFNCEKTINGKIEKQIENSIPVKQNYLFSISILEKDANNKPIKLNIKIKKNNKIVQQIKYNPGFWSSNI